MRTYASPFFLRPVKKTCGSWDRCKYLQLGRAVWRFSRKPEGVVVTYRNLLIEKEYVLGTVSREMGLFDLLSRTFAEHWETSVTAGDWVIVDAKILAVGFETGST